MSTRDTIEPIITRTYGSGEMARALVEHLAERIDAYDGLNLTQTVLVICWDWFPGGTTAATLADEIVAKLALASGEME